MAVFVGTHAMKIDGKSRVSMPAPFRDALRASGNGQAVLMPTEGSPVIEGCHRAFIDQLVERAYTPGAMSDEARERVLLMLGEIVELTIDPEGRFVFPASLRQHGAIEDQAIFVGQGRTFQILSPAQHTATRGARKAKAGVENVSLTQLFFQGAGKP